MSGLTARKPAPGEPVVMSQHTNERLEFEEFYSELRMNPETERMVCTGPLAYVGEAEVCRDIEQFRTALEQGSGPRSQEQFMCVLAPGWIEHSLWNEFYPNDEAFLFAIADAMKSEYRAIVEAGFILQLDDPGLPDTYDMIVPLCRDPCRRTEPCTGWITRGPGPLSHLLGQLARPPHA
jgi:5-methyltetrahydropteroyltriglutamate--homocysteine methyltransferase